MILAQFLLISEPVKPPANTTPDAHASIFPRRRGLESPRTTIFPAMPLGKQINSEHGYRI